MIVYWIWKRKAVNGNAGHYIAYKIMYQKNLNLKSNNFDWVALIRRGHGGVSEMILACYFWSDDLASQAYAPDANLKGGKCGAGARARFSLPTLRFPVKGLMGLF